MGILERIQKFTDEHDITLKHSTTTVAWKLLVSKQAYNANKTIVECKPRKFAYRKKMNTKKTEPVKYSSSYISGTLHKMTPDLIFPSGRCNDWHILHATGGLWHLSQIQGKELPLKCIYLSTSTFGVLYMRPQQRSALPYLSKVCATLICTQLTTSSYNLGFKLRSPY